ncbi:MAG: 4-(cytidine 5'-diphospho)-2-C-methyl-D-erythritol kinase [Nocardioidaceae bacterium]
MTSVTVRTPAKINLALMVDPPRADGYHPLATVYQAVSLFDHVTAQPAADGQLTLELVSDDQPQAVLDLPTDDQNLALRAARLLARHTGAGQGARLRLRKAIPVAGGMAGGSSDAAAALVACDALWQTAVPAEELRVLAADLGSDVPFCLLGGTAIGSGRGELVSPALTLGRYHWVVAVADEGLPTAAVYAELDRLRADPSEQGRRHQRGGLGQVSGRADLAVPRPLMNALRTGDAAALGRALENELQPAALSLRPGLSELLNVARACGALGAMVSGSGPTCVFLANDEAHALDIGVGLTSAGGCRTVHRVVGPVLGARRVSG